MVVDQAEYQLNDGNGQTVVLLVNYRQNSYQLKPKQNLTDQSFYHEAERLARGLLARKHAVNLAEREQYL